MSHLDRHRAERRRQLTVGDGFRIGLGIAFWHLVLLAIGYFLVFVGAVALGALGR